MARKTRNMLRSSRMLDGPCLKNLAGATPSVDKKIPVEKDSVDFQRFDTKPLSYKGLSSESIKSVQNPLKYLFNYTETDC